MLVPGLERNYNIRFEHIATGHDVTFPGWVTGFSDSFMSSWNDVPVYGRMDPLSTFQSTTRKINLTFDIVAASQEEAYTNDRKINRLIQFLYPVYDNKERADEQIISAAPLLKLQWANEAQSNLDQGGLVGYLEGVDYAPDINSGQFFGGAEPNSKESGFYKGGGDTGSIYYQLISLNLNFTVLHTHMTGWVKGGENTFYFGKSSENAAQRAESTTANLDNFPHGGTNRFAPADGFAAPAPVQVTPDPTKKGADAVNAEAGAEELTEGKTKTP